ncbi:MAG: hypothetical protein IJ877_05410 [Candidatus Gastranaerophilales bacterium]|nr:hypothetical protein [Candidatus Gastranaerophilales bacterium]
MKRRDLLKTSLLTLGASSLALSGCNKEIAQSDELEIIPKQTGTYEFSVPLPFNYEIIDELSRINATLKKSKIVTLYNNIPLPLNDKFNSFIHIVRGSNPEIKSFDDFAKYAKYAMDKGFRICYLMNSPKGFSERDFKTFEKDFYYILDYLVKLGIDEVKFSNTQVADLINAYHPFKLSASTNTEYHNITQYRYLVENYPNVYKFNMAIDENQNFKLLNSIRTLFPDRKIEVTVNDLCLKGCPARISHGSDESFCVYKCGNIKESQDKITPFYRFTKASLIYPWNLEYYSAIGINNFKYLAQIEPRAIYKTTQPLKNYLNIVENGIENVSADTFFNDTLFILLNHLNGVIRLNQNTALSTIMPYLPDINYFIKNGDKCATRCGIECDYCKTCALKIQQAIDLLS